jgi:iron complex outermembrane recepter protein
MGVNAAERPTDSISEIIVTAQKREQRLMDVPAAITVLDSNRIASYGANRMAGLQYMVPNLVMTQDKPSSVGVFIRGVGNNTRNIGTDVRAGVYLDGVYLGRSQAVNLETTGLERVEVMRGPQGTLFGMNTVSGAINLITGKPAEDFGGTVSTTLGQFDQIGAHVKVNVPLSAEGLFMQGDLTSNRKRGYVHNSHTGDDMNGADSLSGRIKLRYRPGSNLDANLSVDWFEEDLPAIHRQAVTATKNLVAHDTVENDFRDVRGLALSVDYTLANDYRLSSISAFRESDFRSFYDEDYLPLYVAASDFNEDSRLVTQEFRLSSPLYERHDYVAGLYLFSSDASSSREASLGPYATGGLVLPVHSDASVEDDSAALYFHGNYRLNDRTELTGGMRYTWEKKSIVFAQRDLTGLFTSLPAAYRDDADIGEITTEAGMKYHLNDSALLYGKYSSGFKSGGWNADFISSVERLPFGSEYVDSVELGLKASLLDGIVDTEIAIFEARYDDYQVQQFSLDSKGGTIIVVSNAGEVSSKGVEAEVRAQFDSLTVALSAGVNDAKYEEYKNANGPGVHLDGERVGTARGNFNLLTSHHYGGWAVADIDFSLEYSHRLAEGTKGPLYTVDTTIPAYGIVNARISLNFANSGLRLLFWGKNIADKSYLVAHDASFLGTPRWLFGERRTFGVTASYDF